MRTYTRSRQVAGAAAAALALTLGACGSDDSSSSSEEGGSSSEGTSSSGTSSSSASSAGDDAAGASSATVDGKKVKTEGWRAICARSPDGKSGSAVLMEDVTLDQLKKNPEAEHGFITTHFDIKGDRATVTVVSVTRAQSAKASGDGDLVSYSGADDRGKATMTMTEDAVHVEGEGQQTNSDGERREGIPFTIDVACTGWQDLTNEGDVQQPGG